LLCGGDFRSVDVTNVALWRFRVAKIFRGAEDGATMMTAQQIVSCTPLPTRKGTKFDS
jgi:hypothetical protein